MERTVSEKVIIAMSSYATHKDYTLTEWFAIKKEMAEHLQMLMVKPEGLQRRVG